MNFKGFKKVHEDESKAILKNQMGHTITISKKALSPEHAEGLKKLPLHQAEPDSEVGGDDTKENTENNMPDEKPGGGVNIYVGGAAPAEGQAEKTPVNPSDQTQPGEPGQPAPAQPAQQASVPTAAAPTPAAAPAPAAPVPSPDNIVPQAQQQTLGTPQQDATEQQKQEYLDQANKYAQDLAVGHITPATYSSLFAKKDTLGKIGTLFGLLVGGAGSGITGQPNPVLHMMDQELKNDMEAQTTSKANAQNFLRLNQHNELQKAQIPELIASGTLKGAEALRVLAQVKIDSDTHAINQARISLLHNLGMLGGSLPADQQPKAAAALQPIGQAVQNQIQQTAAKAAQQKAQIEQNFANRQKGLTAAGMGDISTLETEKHVPGFGDSSIPVPADTRRELTAKLDFDKAAQQYVDFAKKHQANWTSLNPEQRLAVEKQGGVLGAILQGKFREATHGGVYKTGEQQFIKTVIPDNPVSMLARFNQIPKVQQTIDSNRMSTATLARTAGLPEPKWEKSNAQAAPLKEGQTGTYHGKPVVVKGGKWSYP